MEQHPPQQPHEATPSRIKRGRGRPRGRGRGRGDAAFRAYQRQMELSRNRSGTSMPTAGEPVQSDTVAHDAVQQPTLENVQQHSGDIESPPELFSLQDLQLQLERHGRGMPTDAGRVHSDVGAHDVVQQSSGEILQQPTLENVQRAFEEIVQQPSPENVEQPSWDDVSPSLENSSLPALQMPLGRRAARMARGGRIPRGGRMSGGGRMSRVGRAGSEHMMRSQDAVQQTFREIHDDTSELLALQQQLERGHGMGIHIVGNRVQSDVGAHDAVNQLASEDVEQPPGQNVHQPARENVQQPARQNVYWSPAENVQQPASQYVYGSPPENIQQPAPQNVYLSPPKNAEQYSPENVQQPVPENVQQPSWMDVEEPALENVQQPSRMDVEEPARQNVQLPSRENVQELSRENVQQPDRENQSPREKILREMPATAGNMVWMSTCTYAVNLPTSFTPELVDRARQAYQAEVGEDLAATTRARAPTRRSRRIVESVPTTMISADGMLTKIRCRPSDSAVSHPDNPHSVEIPDKVQEEMNIINNRLFDTFLEISTVNAQEVPASSQIGIRLSCTYKAMGVSADWGYMKPKPYTVFLIVPPAYPEHSPHIWFDESINEAEAEAPWYEGVREKFMQCIICRPAPTSLSEIAITWDQCARNALNEYAIQHGGGNFTRAIGVWETKDF